MNNRRFYFPHSNYKAFDFCLMILPAASASRVTFVVPLSIFTR